MNEQIKNILHGQTEEHLISHERVYGKIHREALNSFLNLQLDAATEGIDLQIASGFRSYERQLTIWNEKVRGERALFDDHGNELEKESLSDHDLVYAILRFSALPGLSRHHWGTEIDVFDANALPSQEYKLQLSPDEYADDGIFSKLHNWLAGRETSNQSHGFYRPYLEDRGGIASERWHLSYRPVSKHYSELLDEQQARDFVINLEIELKDVVLDHFNDIYKRFVKT